MLFVGDDWAEDHHDLAVLDPEGRVLKQVRVPEGVDGITAFTETVAGCMPDDDGDPSEVLVCIEIDHGPWVQALQAAGYRVFGVDPKQAKRHRESVSSSGAKSDKSDARALADMVRTRRLQLRESGGDSELAESIKVVARAHQRAVWDLARHSNRMRAVLRLYFPVVLTIASELDVAFSSSVILGLLDKCAARPVKARKLTGPQVKSLLYRRREQDLKTARIRELLREEPLPQSEVMLQAYATTVLAEVAILRAIAGQVTVLEKELAGHFSQHPLAEIYLSQPGVGVTIGPRLLGEFGDLPDRYRSAKARRNAAGTSPITKQSGKSRVVHARHFTNTWLLDAAIQQAGEAIRYDSHARAFYNKQRKRDVKHNAALRQLANKLIGILHGCLARHELYNPSIAWSQAQTQPAA